METNATSLSQSLGASSLLSLASFPDLLSLLDTHHAHSRDQAIIVEHVDPRGNNYIGSRGIDIAWTAQDKQWNTGITLGLLAEAALGWHLPIWSQFEGVYRMIETSPSVHLEGHGIAVVDIHLWFVEMKWTLDMNIVKFTPFDILFKFDPEYPLRNCVGMHYGMKGLTLSLLLDYKINECYLGFLAYTWSGFDPFMCAWRHYPLELPIWSY